MTENRINKAERKVRTKFYRRFTEIYEPTWWLKEQFLETGAERVMKNAFNQYTLDSMRRLLLKVGKWENRYGKDVFDFTTEEIKGMLKEFNSNSENSLMAQKSNLQYYLMYAKANGMGNVNIPATIALSSDDIRTFINPIGKESRYVTREQLYDLVEPQYDDKGMLISGFYNAVDRAFIMLTFEGILGKQAEDMLNLKWRDVENGIKNGELVYDKKMVDDKEQIYYVRKSIDLNDELANTLEETINDEIYQINNGRYLIEFDDTKPKTEYDEKKIKARKRFAKILDKYDSDFLFRPLEQYDYSEGKVSYGTMQQRILNEFKLIEGCETINFKTIYTSGLIDRAIRHSNKVYGDKMMKRKDYIIWLEENHEGVNIQLTFDLFREFWDKAHRVEE